MVSRADKSRAAQWLWTVDRGFLAAFLALMGIGIVLAFAASPAVAERIGLPSYHFVIRQISFMAMSVVVLIGVSFLTPRQVRRLALVMLVASLLALVATLYVGMEVKGSRRWLSILGFSFQPSEFLKPAFAVICAWLFSEHSRQPEVPGNLFAIVLLGLVVALLVAQPDFGQSILFALTWSAMFFMAGVPWIWIIGLGAIGAGGALVAYVSLPHVSGRIDRFLSGEGDTYQVDMGREAIINGGWFGRGPGEGTVKRILPDSHTDFIFSVAAEEFGIVMCMLIAMLFAFIVLRGLHAAMRREDDFSRYAIAGLVIMFGLQAAINIGVNLQLLPAKGMTLPFVSYGGSSLLAVAVTMGMVLALTRKRPEPRKRPGMVAGLSTVHPG